MKPLYMLISFYKIYTRRLRGNALTYPRFEGVVLFVRHEKHNIIYEKTFFTDH